MSPPQFKRKFNIISLKKVIFNVFLDCITFSYVDWNNRQLRAETVSSFFAVKNISQYLWFRECSERSPCHSSVYSNGMVYAGVRQPIIHTKIYFCQSADCTWGFSHRVRISRCVKATLWFFKWRSILPNFHTFTLLSNFHTFTHQPITMIVWGGCHVRLQWRQHQQRLTSPLPHPQIITLAYVA